MLGATLLCRLEENDKLVLTPFEKNIDIWRQLWRVVERSDLVSKAPPSLPLLPTNLVIDCLPATFLVQIWSVNTCFVCWTICCAMSSKKFK
jgi:hypothetical protein